MAADPSLDPADPADPADCAVQVCPEFHEAVELIGRRWSGAILRVLIDRPLRFSEVTAAIPQLSDRLLSERLKELESRGLVTREVVPGPPLQVRYGLSRMGSELEPALAELEEWAQRWLQGPGRATTSGRGGRPDERQRRLKR